MKTENLPVDLAAKLDADKARFEAAISDADDVFWAEIVAHYPEIITGDLSPGDTFLWHNVQRRTVQAWLEANAVQETA